MTYNKACQQKSWQNLFRDLALWPVRSLRVWRCVLDPRKHLLVSDLCVVLLYPALFYDILVVPKWLALGSSKWNLLPEIFYKGKFKRASSSIASKYANKYDRRATHVIHFIQIKLLYYLNLTVPLSFSNNLEQLPFRDFSYICFPFCMFLVPVNSLNFEVCILYSITNLWCKMLQGVSFFTHQPLQDNYDRILKHNGFGSLSLAVTHLSFLHFVMSEPRSPPSQNSMIM